MAQQQLDGAHVGTRFEKMGRECIMAQHMRRNRLADTGAATGLSARQPYRRWVDGLVGEPSREKPVLRPAVFQELRRISSSRGESITWRSICPVPCSI